MMVSQYGHIICYKCINTHFKRYKTTNHKNQTAPCPTCRKEIRGESLA